MGLPTQWRRRESNPRKMPANRNASIGRLLRPVVPAESRRMNLCGGGPVSVLADRLRQPTGGCLEVPTAAGGRLEDRCYAAQT
jgi:hypothetical protein